MVVCMSLNIITNLSMSTTMARGHLLKTDAIEKIVSIMDIGLEEDENGIALDPNSAFMATVTSTISALCFGQDPLPDSNRI